MNGTTHGFELMEPASPEALIPDSRSWPMWAWVVLVVLLVIVMIWFRRKKRSPVATSLAVRKAAFAAAVEALDRIAADDVRDAAVQASWILRSYLSVAAGDPALYETHEEFVLRHHVLESLTPNARMAAQAGFDRLASLKYSSEISEEFPLSVIAESRVLLEVLHHGYAT